MNALEYARDNRLRLWFLGIDEYKVIKQKEIGKTSNFEADMLRVLNLVSKIIKPGGPCILILGDVKRATKKYDVPALITNLVSTNSLGLLLESQWIEKIPDSRRVRKNGQATEKETILVFRRKYG
jgi:hypothetical protein